MTDLQAVGLAMMGAAFSALSINFLIPWLLPLTQVWTQ